MTGPFEHDLEIDVGRLSKPEAEAFRYIASALGASFAGDLPSPGRSSALTPAPALNENDAPEIDEDGHTSRTQGTLPASGSHHSVAPADPKRARLLDRVPIPLVVVDGDTIAFINRTALGVLGYGSAAILDAAGGLSALLGAQPGRDGLLSVRSATGTPFAARVEMAPIEWGFAGALLLSVVPVGARRPEADGPGSAIDDPLRALLDAIPSPLAIVNRAGEVEACNRAFVALGPTERAVVRLDERLNPSDLRHLMDLVEGAFSAGGGPAETKWPLTCGGAPHFVSVGTLAGASLACVSFQRHGGAREAAEPTGARLVAIAQAAASDTRTLVGEVSVLLVHRRHGPAAALTPGDRDAVQCLRTILLGAAARAPVGTVMTLESDAEAIALRLSPAPHAADIAGLVERMAPHAAECGLVLCADRAGVRVVEAHAQTRLTA